jgi:ABC-2 type transport system permease protein
MGDAWTIATKDLRRRLRDRTAVLVALVLPFGLAFIFSLTLGDVENQSFEATYAVVDRDTTGHLPAEFTALLEGLDFVTLREAATEDAAVSLADDGSIDAAIVFPEGFSEQVQAGRGGAIRVIAAADAQIASLVAESLATSFASNLDAVGLSVAVVADAGGPADEALVARAQAVAPAAELRTADAKDQAATQSSFFAIGMAVFFLFFAVEFGVRGLLEER